MMIHIAAVEPIWNSRVSTKMTKCFAISFAIELIRDLEIPCKHTRQGSEELELDERYAAAGSCCRQAHGD